MRRLPGILLLTGAALVVIAALLVSGLRIALPHLDAWRPEILNKIESATGMPVEASQLSASWQNFGPTLEAHDIRAELKDGGEFSVKRVTLALDVWQSLLHMRWQFRDLTFWQLRFRAQYCPASIYRATASGRCHPPGARRDHCLTTPHHRANPCAPASRRAVR